MWVDIARHSKRELDAADTVYRRWARSRLRSGQLVAFLVETGDGVAAASGCVWVQDSQPRPGWKGTKQGYLLSMYTDPAQRGKGFATRIVREAVRWAGSQGLDRMSLHAAEAGYRIYVRAGFQRTHEMRRQLSPSKPTRKKAR